MYLVTGRVGQLRMHMSHPVRSTRKAMATWIVLLYAREDFVFGWLEILWYAAARTWELLHSSDLTVYRSIVCSWSSGKATAQHTSMCREFQASWLYIVYSLIFDISAPLEVFLEDHAISHICVSCSGDYIPMHWSVLRSMAFSGGHTILKLIIYMTDEVVVLGIPGLPVHCWR